MAIETNNKILTKTKKANKITLEKSELEDILKNLPKYNADVLLDNMQNTIKELSDVYNGSKGNFPKIESKPFYYDAIDNCYIADPARYQCPNSNDAPSSVENVPTTRFYYDLLDNMRKYNR